MQKILNYLLMAATVCGISLAAASCSSNDDGSTFQQGVTWKKVE